jgi:sugar lactone lactonase YvrE
MSRLADRFVPLFRLMAAVPVAVSVAASVIGSTADTAAGAEMLYPLSVAVTEGGEIFIADRELPGIWRIKDAKQTQFFAGSKKFKTPLNAIRCVAIDAQGRLLAGDSSTREIYRFGAQGAPTPLTQGGIGIPMALAVNSKGEILVCDLETHQIVKVPEDGGTPEKFAEIRAPRGIAVDPQDRVWVVAHAKNQVVRFDAAGQAEVIVEGRPFQFPHTIALDEKLNAYICDGYAKTVWKVPVGGKPEKWIDDPRLVNPVGVAYRGGRLLIADPRAKSIFAAETAEGMGKLSAVELVKE